MTPRLQAPPIVEVVCGFFFPPVPDLDPLAVGKYWAEEKEKQGFKRGPLQPPVNDRPGLTFGIGEGVGPIRSWLVSASDEYVLQIQPDRFYFNWRFRGGEYPHFRDVEGTEGVLTRSLRELDELSAFCKRALEATPTPVRVELAKIDQLVQGRHFQDFRDLAQLVPVVAPVSRVAKSPEPMVNLNVIDNRDGLDVLFQMTNAPLAPRGPAVQLETRAMSSCEGRALKDVFIGMNEAVNDVFFGIVDDSASGWARFGGEKR